MSDGESLTALIFTGQKYYDRYVPGDAVEKNIPLFKEVEKWLNLYFRGEIPDFMPPIQMTGTDFQQEVWSILLTIPYGKTTTYGEIARRIAEKRKLESMSAQAVGGAVGRNPVSIIVPCHRVVGKNGSMTGYAGGTDRKIYLLQLEQKR